MLWQILIGHSLKRGAMRLKELGILSCDPLVTLLEARAKIHAVVRNPLTTSARELEGKGVKIFQGTHESFDTFLEAAKGCNGLSLNLIPFAENRQAMPRQARGIIQACKDAKVEIIVVSTAFFTRDRSKWDRSGNGYDDPSPRAYFEAKAEVEDMVRNSGLQYTILRPAWIHSNYLLPNSRFYYPGLATDNELVHSYDDRVKISHISLVGIRLQSPQNRAEITRVVGRNLELKKRTPQEVETARATVPIQIFQLWASHVDLSIDGQSLQARFGIPMTTSDKYLQREKERKLISFPKSDS
ncbi:NmrA family protein [Annulohypoxylon truncatum]|uniref:NmrA family protein n=1 Tax=Annulohypoxylon truncatum TaxID=327061 RepID=UPI00200735DE|nr:NmrA family protein [Annulohypoxylon truncatum]KAI1205343.1 NmrA family protein [Annulohypoxylon truncatum]